MAHENRIDDLVVEVLESDRRPEDVCAHCPELLGAVQARLRKLNAMEAMVDSLFPVSTPRATEFDVSMPKQDDGLPVVPDYDVQGILGRGGMGIVYRAQHRKLSRVVALKMLLAGSYAGRQEHARFIREAESVAALRHPNIVQIYELGEVNGNPYFTMEYLGGGNLAQKMAGRPQPVRDAAKLILTLAAAVEAAHTSGVVHRDLKPANILLSDDGAPKIADFGLARRLDRDSSLTATGAFIGTPGYMAPEQLGSAPSSAGHAVDFFALGAILYEMLTGRPPFRGATLSDTERRLRTEEPTPPSRFNPKVPRDLETICLKCLEKEPHSRYSSSSDLAADLERFLQHEPIRARPVARTERWMRFVRRHPLPTALAATFVLLFGLIAIEVGQQMAHAAARKAEKVRLAARLESGLELVREGRLAEARAILGKLGDGGFSDLRQQIDVALADLNLVERLEAVGVERATALNSHDVHWLPNAKAASEYEALFEAASIAKTTDDATIVAARVRASNVKDSIIAALDDWAVCELDDAQRRWILAIARQAGSSEDWHVESRDASTWTDRFVLASLAESAPFDGVAVVQLRALGDRMVAAELDAIPFRIRVQEAHVDSFLANLSLADALQAAKPAEALRYYQAALAIRSQSATAHNNLAVALVRLGRIDEGLSHLNQAVSSDPKSAAIHYNLGVQLAKSEPEAAIEHFTTAVDLNPQLALAHRALGEILMQEGRYSDAAKSLRICLSLLAGSERDEVNELLQRCERLGAGPTPSP